jgi:succinate dehydrogenase assembly factor 1
MIRTKPLQTQPKFLLLVQHHFRSRQNVSPRDVNTIEYLLRQGKRQIELWGSKSIRDCFVTEEMKAWAEQRRRR